MKIRILMLVILMWGSHGVKAQGNAGVNFENKLSWTQILEKAKIENKHIFLDFYTTWCGPCKQMTKEVFPLSQVGAFFNKSFINVAIQMDLTKKDNAYVKSWYKDAERLGKTYNISSYPTYIVLDADGKLVHTIKGANFNVDSFLGNVKLALDPKTQYSGMQTRYNNGQRDSTFLLQLVRTAQRSRDFESINGYITAYLAIDTNWTKKENLVFITQVTRSSKDKTYHFLLSHQDLIDAAVGENTSRNIIKTIVSDEIVLPIIRKDGKKIVTQGGMILMSGEPVKNVDWSQVKGKLDSDYPDLSEEIIADAKPQYYRSLGDWEKYSESVTSYASNQRWLNLTQLANYTTQLLYECDDAQHYKSAIKWCEIIMDGEDMSKKPWTLKNYSTLLYKTGQKDLAIKSMEKYIKYVDNDENAINELKEMRESK